MDQKQEKTKFRMESQQERTAKAKLQMEKRWDKLETTRNRLANQKPPKKRGPLRRVGRAAGHGVHGFVHGKLYEVEHENVGTEGLVVLNFIIPRGERGEPGGSEGNASPALFGFELREDGCFMG